MKLRKILTLFFAMLLTLPLSACNAENDTDIGTSNLELRYATYDYNLSTEFDGNSPPNMQNFTRTSNLLIASEKADSVKQYAAGWTVLKSAEDWQNVLSLEQGWKDLRHQYLSEYISEEQYDNWYGDTPLLVEGEKTEAFVFDDSFFENNNLLLIDLCYGGALRIDLMPEALSVTGKHVDFEISFGGRISSTADNYGAITLIPVPKEYTVDCVHLRCDTELLEVGNPLG